MAKNRGKAKMRAASSEAVIKPAAERWARREVERSPDAVIDAQGNRSMPYRAIDTLMAMERAGTIDAKMRRAGNKFRDDFSIACLDPLRAQDIRRDVRGDGRSGPAMAQLDARDRVWEALSVLGGQSSPAATCAWQVLGVGVSLHDWARREGWRGRPVHRKVASGILVGALGILVDHYGY